jgi:hypothetical protein
MDRARWAGLGVRAAVWRPPVTVAAQDEIGRAKADRMERRALLPDGYRESGRANVKADGPT